VKTTKDTTLDLICSLREEVTWDEIIYHVWVRKKIEEGIQAADDGRIVSHDEVKKLFGRLIK
jgi:predicted transcriptional regulator